MQFEVMNLQVQYNGQQLDMRVRTALTHDDKLLPLVPYQSSPNPFSLSDGWDMLASVSPSRGSAEGGITVSFVGYGFRYQAQYKCLFFTVSREAEEAEEEDAVVSSTTALSCRTPVWGLRHAAALTVIDTVRVLTLLDGPVTTIPFTNMSNAAANTSGCLRFPQHVRCVFDERNGI